MRHVKLSAVKPPKVPVVVGDIPEYIVRIKYLGKSLEERRKKLDDGKLRGYTRYLYVYEHESLDERIGKAWREDARAEVFMISAAKSHEVAASSTRGIWE